LQIVNFRYIIISNGIKTLEISFIQLNNSRLETERKDKQLIDTESNKKKQKGKQKIKKLFGRQDKYFCGNCVMTKSLSDRIALYANKNKSTCKQFLPAFIALKPDIEQALKDGWTIRQIWNILHQEKKIKCSYQWFRTLVNRHIGEDRKQHPRIDQGKSAGNGHEGFRFNSATEKEELV
jgi:aerobic-type carbon monoxide dehydrogenase small subunit (CoxS/CutS family)